MTAIAPSAPTSWTGAQREAGAANAKTGSKQRRRPPAATAALRTYAVYVMRLPCEASLRIGAACARSVVGTRASALIRTFLSHGQNFKPVPSNCNVGGKAVNGVADAAFRVGSHEKTRKLRLF